MKEYICFQACDHMVDDTPDGKSKAVESFADGLQFQLDYYAPLGWQLHSITPVITSAYLDYDADMSLEEIEKETLRHQLLIVLVREKKEK